MSGHARRDERHDCIALGVGIAVIVLLALLGLAIATLVKVHRPATCSVTFENCTNSTPDTPVFSKVVRACPSCELSQVCCHGICYPETNLPPGCTHDPGAPGNDIFCELTTAHCPNGTFCCQDPCGGGGGECSPTANTGKCRAFAFPGRCGPLEVQRLIPCDPVFNTCPGGLFCCHGFCRDPSHGACKTAPLTFGK